jgi:hypothetical protein
VSPRRAPHAGAAAACALAAVAAACGGYGSAAPPDGAAGGPGAAGTFAGGVDAAAGATAALPAPTATPDFQLRPEFTGACTATQSEIDVNLGNSPEAFVRAAYCQVNGSEPPADTVTQWAQLLRTVEYVRRVDVVRSFCSSAKRACALAYTDPWQVDLPLAPTCTRKGTRDLGAVLMFFSDCPRGVNCGMDWANTHASGMSAPHALYGFDSSAMNYYNPRNAGWWYRELQDAAWAGLQFFLLNTYGPDLGGSPDQIAMLGEALAKAGPGGVKVALFDDPWAWGQTSSPPPFKTRPNMSDTEGAAQAIYTAKWKPFYSRIDKQYWYTFRGQPFIYFYNAGTLNPLNVSAAVVARLKQLFAADFGVMPFVAVERAYFQDPNMPSVADSEFTWNTLGNGNGGAPSVSTMGGVTLDHFMVKWDTVGRDRPGAIAAATDHIIKSTSVLSQRMADAASADIAVIATWNDLGEGTGVERNYDYYIAGAWAPPTAFMNVTRAAQCSD